MKPVPRCRGRKRLAQVVRPYRPRLAATVPINVEQSWINAGDWRTWLFRGTCHLTMLAQTGKDQRPRSQ